MQALIVRLFGRLAAVLVVLTLSACSTSVMGPIKNRSGTVMVVRIPAANPGNPPERSDQWAILERAFPPYMRSAAYTRMLFPGMEMDDDDLNVGVSGPMFRGETRDGRVVYVWMPVIVVQSDMGEDAARNALPRVTADVERNLRKKDQLFPVTDLKKHNGR